MDRFVSLPLLSVLVFTIAGCRPVAPTGAGPATSSGAGEATPATPAQRTTLKVAYVPVLAFGPLYRALTKGYFSAAGLDIDLSIVQSASDTIAFLGNGQLDAALGNVGAPFFNAVNRGLEVKVVAGNSFNQLDAATLAAAPLLVRRQLVDDGTVKSAADLKGRKIAINTIGGIQEYSLSLVLDRAQLAVRDVDVQTIAFPDMLTALGNGAIDAAMLPEPFSASARDQGIVSVLVPNPAPGATVTAVLFGESLLKPEQERPARAFLDALRKAANELQTEQEVFSAENLAIWAQYTGVAEERIQKGAAYAYAPNLVLDVQSLLDQQQFLLNAGRLDFKDALPETRIVDSRFVVRS
jgi:NitT/TauT family transport system substrate-binding protein